jgi:hypothetical protein
MEEGGSRSYLNSQVTSTTMLGKRPCSCGMTSHPPSINSQWFAAAVKRQCARKQQ